MKAFSNTTDTRIALLEQSIGHINDSLKSIDNRFEKIDKRFDKIDEKFDKIDEQFREIRKESKSQFWYTLTFIVALVGLPIIQNIITHFWSH